MRAHGWMKLLALVFVSLLSWATAVPARSQAMGGEACAALDDAEVRLACYDQIFRPSGEAVSTVVAVPSQELIPATPTGRSRAQMIVLCLAGELTVQFSFAGHVLSPIGSNISLSVQPDLLNTRNLSLPPSDDGRSAVITGEATEAFLRSLEGVSSIRVRVTPANSRELTVTFPISEHFELLTDLRSCSI